MRALLPAVLCSLALAAGGQEPAPAPGPAGCLACHAGIEDMHPASPLACTDCHGGDATATTKQAAHVRPSSAAPADERVAPAGEDLAWRRFVNPMDLRVAPATCGGCHQELVEHLAASLHGTTAGHLSDGYYEMGLVDSVGSRYAVMPVSGAPVPGGEVAALVQPPPFRAELPEGELKTHFTDLVRKECMQCHLWSAGRAVRGRVGFDGDYRGEGCAACHVAYTLEGLSSSADATIPKGEPGHPARHALQRAPTTQTCTSCHYGDASIGLQFRGLSQLPPGAPGGPDIPGTTSRPLNRAFYLRDAELTPPDVHHERGMHCIDCHTLGDAMGDGRLHGQMEHAVEISCQACHGTFERRSELKTERGTPLEHLRAQGGDVILTSKVDGAEHRVTQVVDVLDPRSPDYNPRAAQAMTGEHGQLECYACHAAWNANFLGFHFSRNASLTQLDLLSGKRTPGRVTTQEKVFATWKGFYAGLDEAGRVAPYLTGFSTMGSVWDERGELVIDQAMPVTARGLSGMTMVHHQMHTTRPTARACVECHRSSTTWGLGSPNFRLTRQLAFVGDRRGLEVVALDRAHVAASPPLAKLVLPDVAALAAHCDDLQGLAHHVYAVEAGRGVHVIDVRDPARPRRAAFAAAVDPRGLALAGDHLYLADGAGGLRIFDVSAPEKIRAVGQLPLLDAQDVRVQWPYAYVADGPGGLAVVDVRAPIAPRLVSTFDLNGDDGGRNDAVKVATLFQNSRPTGTDDQRTDARMVVAVLDSDQGLYLVDATEPLRPELLFPSAGFLASDRTRGGAGRRGARNVAYRGLALLSHVDLGEAQGGEPTRERDYAYVMVEGTLDNGMRRSRLILYDVTDPTRARSPNATVETGYGTSMLVPAQVYNPPFLETFLFSAGELGVLVGDLSLSREPKQAGVLPGLFDARAVAFEEFPLDRMVDELGRKLKDVSRAPSRWLSRAEIERILDVPGERLGTLPRGFAAPPPAAQGARLILAQLDADRSGLLDGAELAGGEGALDRDGDGRVSLLELAEAGGQLPPAPQPETGTAEPMPAAQRAGPDGDGELARLLDGLDPRAFDRDKNGALDRREAERALFAALDLDGDEKLSPDEASRQPGEARGLRFGDSAAHALFARLDRNSDGSLGQREVALRDADWQVLDADGDGRVELAPEPGRRAEGAAAPRPVEWPERRERPYALPPTLTREVFYAAFDPDGDGLPSKREMKGRGELFAQLDRDGSGLLEAPEIDGALDRIFRRGVDATVDDFQGRWDLDGDGTVEPGEIPDAPALRTRGIGKGR